jgi:hypothetical protein
VFTARYGLQSLYGVRLNFRVCGCVVTQGGLVAGFSLRSTGFDPRPVRVRFVVGNDVMGGGFLQVLWISAISVISTDALSSFLFKCCLFQKDKRESPGNLSKSNSLSEIGEGCRDKYFGFWGHLNCWKCFSATWNIRSYNSE